VSLTVKRVIGLLFFLPWASMELLQQNGQRADSAYWVGLVCGLITAYIWSEKPPKVWIMAVLGTALATIRLIIIYGLHLRLVHQ
jgi:predicted RNase H-like nuclease